VKVPNTVCSCGEVNSD